MNAFQHIIVFTGAGVSEESGISTFRGGNGLWEKYKIENVATVDAWNANPNLVQEFYNLRRESVRKALPNAAHLLIASLEKRFKVKVITQNIDDLHERAGSSDVLHLHGNILFAKSSQMGAKSNLYSVPGDLDITRDFCPDGYPLRPAVVWFGEEVPNFDVARKEMQTATLLLVIGTSLNVYPAAGLIHCVPKECHCFVIDPNVDELSIPTHFKAIKLAASEGVTYFIDTYLK